MDRARRSDARACTDGLRERAARARSRRATALLARTLLASAALATAAGCALLIPPAWRERSPVPLAGPIDAARPPAPEAGTSDTAVVEALRADRARLLEILGRPTAPDGHEEFAELREIGSRMPQLQADVEAGNARLPGRRIRHPVIK